MIDRWTWRAAAFAALVLFPFGGAAQDVTLTSRDGTLEIPGTLQGFDGEVYRILSPYGPLTVDSEGVICEGPGCPDLTAFVATVRIVGSQDEGARLVPALLAAFAKQGGYVLSAEADQGSIGFALTDPAAERSVARFTFTELMPDQAAEALRLGAADLALAVLPEPDLSSRVLGLEALVAVAHPDNPLVSISTADLARVLSGEVANWSDLGGPDLPLVQHATAPGTPSRLAIEARLGKGLARAQEHASADRVDAAVGRDPYGIAVLPAGAVRAARVLQLTDSCGFLLEPGSLQVKAEDYPLTQATLLLSPKRRLPLVAREFLDFASGPGADPALSEAGLTGRGLERAELVTDGLRLANAIRMAGPAVGIEELQRLTTAMLGAERLSLTFRFDGGSRALDAASRNNLADLIRLIEIGTFEDQELVFAGFSDGSGGTQANLDLSRQRAETLREEVAAAVPDLGDLRVSLASEAFGEALPIACDESAIGRQLNRRVELWLRAMARDTPAP